VEQVNDHSPIDVSTFGDEPMGLLTRRDVAEILEHRVAEVFDLIQREIKRSGYDGLLPAGLVFCGGAAQLAGLRDSSKSTFNLPVRVASPQNLLGMVDVLGTPAYATAVGLLAWGIEQHEAEGGPRRRLAGKRGSWLSTIRNLVSRLLPG
jgi:cell division protein FtsA